MPLWAGAFWGGARCSAARPCSRSDLLACGLVTIFPPTLYRVTVLVVLFSALAGTQVRKRLGAGELLGQKGAKTPVSALASKEVVGLYFSAHWCVLPVPLHSPPDIYTYEGLVRSPW